MHGNTKHLPGMQIGNKTLLRHVGANRFGQRLWMWRCNECLNEYGPSVAPKIARSKLCDQCARLPHNNGRWRGHQQIRGEWLRQYERDAERRGLAWAVSPEYLWQVWLQQDGACSYTWWKLTHGVDASLDRIGRLGGAGAAHGLRSGGAVMTPDYYDRSGIPITEEQAAELRARPGYLAVARTKILDGQDPTRSYDVSTVWLGLDHSFGEGAPAIFETMVFPEGDAAEIDVRRYPTEALAREGHTATVITSSAELGDPVVMDVP